MDLHVGIFSMNSPALGVACSPPGIGGTFEIVLVVKKARTKPKRSANEMKKLTPYY
jgi:hypothetical protein